MMTKKKIFSTFAIGILLFTILAIAIPNVNAATTITHAYINVAPNPLGVNQTCIIVFWLDAVYSGAAVGNTNRFHNFTLTITSNNGTYEQDVFPIIWDTTSSQFTEYCPLKTGVYNILFTYPGENYSGGYYTPSNASTTLIVQNEQIPDAFQSYPLPTEYWARPIDTQNAFWYTISSNWYNSAKDRNYNGNLNDRYQPDGTAPSTAHIMWGHPIGELTTDYTGNKNYTSLFYNNPIFSTQMILGGNLYYPLPAPGGPITPAGWRMVDLRTGQEIFNYSGTNNPSFGYYLNADFYNQHGVIPDGTLFSANYANGFDASQFTGGISFTVANVPRGVEMVGAHGENLRLSLVNTRSASNPNWIIREWNTSRLFSYSTSVSASNVANASTTTYLDWSYNITDSNGNVINWYPTDAASNTTEVGALFQQDPYSYAVTREVLLCRNGSLPTQGSNSTGKYSLFAVSCINQTINHIKYKPGQIMWTQLFDTNSSFTYTVLQGPCDSGVFTMVNKETGQWTGYSMLTGVQLWTTEPQINYTPYGYTIPQNCTGATVSACNGQLFTAGTGGVVFCYNITTGSLMWKKAYPVGFAADVANYPTHIGLIADGKIYLGTYLATQTSQILAGSMVRCLNATTGDELWSLPAWGSPGGYAVSDGYMAFLNMYDLNVYVVGKGPSQTKVAISPGVAYNNAEVTITGNVTDVSPGSPIEGTAAISDESMNAWMAYKFLGQPKPNDVTGVTVSLYAFDPNNNTDLIGTTTVNTDGTYSYNWTPPVPGMYLITASFEGTNSYYSSNARTSLYVDNQAAPPTATPTESQTPTTMAQSYMAGTTLLIIAEIIIVAAALFVISRKIK
jgi:outer membrane protein assembly factor BamB